MAHMVVKQNVYHRLADNSRSVSFGVCVPRSCTQHVLQDMLAIYHAAPFLGIRWEKMVEHVHVQDRPIHILDYFRIFRDSGKRHALNPVIHNALIHVQEYKYFDATTIFTEHYHTLLMLVAPSLCLTLIGFAVMCYRHHKNGSQSQQQQQPHDEKNDNNNSQHNIGELWVEGSFPHAWECLFARRTAREFQVLDLVRICITILVVIEHLRAFVKWQFTLNKGVSEVILSGGHRVNTMFVVLSTTLLLMANPAKSIGSGVIHWVTQSKMILLKMVSNFFLRKVLAMIEDFFFVSNILLVTFTLFRCLSY